MICCSESLSDDTEFSSSVLSVVIFSPDSLIDVSEASSFSLSVWICSPESAWSPLFSTSEIRSSFSRSPSDVVSILIWSLFSTSEIRSSFSRSPSDVVSILIWSLFSTSESRSFFSSLSLSVIDDSSNVLSCSFPVLEDSSSFIRTLTLFSSSSCSFPGGLVFRF